MVEEGRLTGSITTGITPEQRRATGDLPVGHGIDSVPANGTTVRIELSL